MKIDVEGYETPLLEGAVNTLKNEELCAVIMELNGSGGRYGFDEAEILSMMAHYGFKIDSYAVKFAFGVPQYSHVVNLLSFFIERFAPHLTHFDVVAIINFSHYSSLFLKLKLIMVLLICNNSVS